MPTNIYFPMNIVKYLFYELCISTYKKAHQLTFRVAICTDLSEHILFVG
jgi:hypothetical protein